MKKELRLSVFKEGHDLATLVPDIIKAINDNEGETKATITDLHGYLRCLVCTCPLLFSNVRISLIDEQHLTIDDNMEPILEVREVELHELTGVPTLDYQLNHE